MAAGFAISSVGRSRHTSRFNRFKRETFDGSKSAKRNTRHARHAHATRRRAFARRAHHALGQRVCDGLHGDERLGDLQRVTAFSVPVPRMGNGRRLARRLDRVAFRRDVAARGKRHLPHETGVYNAVQRLLYIVVLLLGVLLVASGLSIWKPVQFDWLANFFGGYDFARRVHFAAMAGVVGFVVVHLALVLLVPRTLPSMVTGRARRVVHGGTDA
jgi:hypothetical protein